MDDHPTGPPRTTSAPPPDQPTLIWKYRAFSREGYSLRLLSHGELFFSPPSKFNDPFDCAIPLRLDLGDPQRTLGLLIEQARRYTPDITAADAEALARSELEADNWGSPEHHRFLAAQARENMERRWKVCSMTSDPGNLLMWSHYSKLTDHLYSLGDIRDLPVRYKEEMPELDATVVEPVDYVHQAIETKYADWHYEKEHRFIAKDLENPVVRFPTSCIYAVVMGIRISAPDRATLISTVRAGQSGATLAQAEANPNSFSLTFREVIPDPDPQEA